MMIVLFRFASAIELALICAEGLVPGSGDILPLGGNHLAQVGVVFGVSFILTEVGDAAVHVACQIRDWLRTFRR
jgi:hypothetical protein